MIIDSPIVSGSFLSTGSLSQIGNATITGSLNVSGSGISLAEGTFSGSGANLFDIPAAGIVGLNLSQIASGSVSAGISPNLGLVVNTKTTISGSTEITGSLGVTGSFSVNGAAGVNVFSSNADILFITGALLVTGSAQITGSLSVSGSITGSLEGTASYSLFALTSSYSLGGSGFPFSGSAVITGSLVISNLVTGSGVRYLVADASGLIEAQTASAAIFVTQKDVATAGQTSFNVVNGYSTGYVTVFVNGTKLSADEYTDTSGTTIVLATGSMVNDVVEFQKYMPAAGVSNNALRQINYFTTTLGQTAFTVDYTPGLLDVFYNGSKLSNVEYTANNGTSITLATGSNSGDTLEVDVYSYQVGAFSGIGGAGAANQLAYYSTTNSITGSNNLTFDGSTLSVTGSFLITGSSTFTVIGPAIFSGSVSAIGGISGTADSASYAESASYAYTASSAINAFSASKAVSSSYSATASFSNDFTVLGNLTVFGTQSVQYITSSQLNISDNVITVNVASPGVRFGGLSVFDSGSQSSEATASLFWDSQQNHWIYQRESGSSYDGGMLISGPRNAAGLGNEQGTTSCMLLVGQGGDHLTSSLVYHDSARTCFYGTSFISSSGAACFGGIICAPSILVGNTGTTTTFVQSCTGVSNVRLNAGTSADMFLGRCDNTNFTNVLYADSTQWPSCFRWSVGMRPAGSNYTIYNEVSSAVALFVCLNNNNVGIGTCTPTQRLQVDGAIKLTGNPSVTGDSSSAQFWNQSGVGPTIAGANFQIQTNGTTNALYIDCAQRVGIGTTAPTEAKVHISGQGTSYGVQMDAALTNSGGSDNLFLRNTASGYWASIGLSANDSDGQHHRAVLKAKKDSAGSFAGQFSIDVRNTGGTYNTAMNVNTYGHITKPYQPFFQAYNNTTVTYNDQIVTYNSTLNNVGSGYSTSTGYFTAPVTGVYLFRVDYRSDGSGGGTVIDIRASTGVFTRHEEQASSYNQYHQTLAAILKLSAGDYAYVYAGAGNIRPDGNSIDRFEGYLLG